jgi:hypothetical protein
LPGDIFGRRSFAQKKFACIWGNGIRATVFRDNVLRAMVFPVNVFQANVFRANVLQANFSRENVSLDKILSID